MFELWLTTSKTCEGAKSFVTVIINFQCSPKEYLVGTLVLLNRMLPFHCRVSLSKLNLKIAKTESMFSNNVNTTIRKYSSRAFI